MAAREVTIFTAEKATPPQDPMLSRPPVPTQPLCRSTRLHQPSPYAVMPGVRITGSSPGFDKRGSQARNPSREPEYGEEADAAAQAESVQVVTVLAMKRWPVQTKTVSPRWFTPLDSIETIPQPGREPDSRLATIRPE